MYNKSLLPYSMQDDSNLALEACINEALSFDMSKFLICIVDNLSDDILLAKAKQFHVLGVEGWQKCKNRTEKQNLLRNAIRSHRLKGTLKSIKDNIDFTYFEYMPWYEYNGNSNHFKFRLYTENPIDLLTYIKIIDVINEYKRLSTKMDSLEINSLIKDDLIINSSLLVSRKTLIF